MEKAIGLIVLVADGRVSAPLLLLETTVAAQKVREILVRFLCQLSTLNPFHPLLFDATKMMLQQGL
jgi:hypothetical protein